MRKALYFVLYSIGLPVGHFPCTTLYADAFYLTCLIFHLASCKGDAVVFIFKYEVSKTDTFLGISLKVFRAQL